MAFTNTLRLAGVAGLSLLAGCHHDCQSIPGCLPQIAALITITSAASGTAVTGATVSVNGDTAHVIRCDGQCHVPGSAGKYVLDIGAPGYQSIQRTITVTSRSQPADVIGPDGYEGQSCGCEVVDEQQVAVSLVPVTGM